MLDLNMNSASTMHVDRIKPQMSVDSSGRVNWIPNLTDYNSDLYYRGKKITDEEFNKLILQGVYQGNYLADSLTELFTKHLGVAVQREFSAAFNLAPSYVKTFSASEWGTCQEDGYHYITIPVSEHGFKLDENTTADTMNIDTEMYLLDEVTGKFFEVEQVETDVDNTVMLYTDDNTLSGFVVIRTNDKAYALTAPTIDATQVTGLADVATSARYMQLIDREIAQDENGNFIPGPDARITKNATDILGILNGDVLVAKASSAVESDSARALFRTSTIQGIPVSSIFEEGSRYVKNATNADSSNYATTSDTSKNVSSTINGQPLTTIFEEDGVTSKNATNTTTVHAIDIFSDTAGAYNNNTMLKEQILFRSTTAEYTASSVNINVGVPRSAFNNNASLKITWGVGYFKNDTPVYPSNRATTYEVRIGAIDNSIYGDEKPVVLPCYIYDSSSNQIIVRYLLLRFWINNDISFALVRSDDEDNVPWFLRSISIIKGG